MSKEVLQEALELLAVATFITPKLQAKRTDVINAGLQELAEQPAQQEPVAWMELLREARDNCKASIAEEGISAIRKEYRIDLEARLTAALNTSPPASKPWVGLTDEEIQKEFHPLHATGLQFARSIEAKLKEKNT